jgi:hypothetical protein
MSCMATPPAMPGNSAQKAPKCHTKRILSCLEQHAPAGNATSCGRCKVARGCLQLRLRRAVAHDAARGVALRLRIHSQQTVDSAAALPALLVGVRGAARRSRSLEARVVGRNVTRAKQLRAILDIRIAAVRREHRGQELDALVALALGVHAAVVPVPLHLAFALGRHLLHRPCVTRQFASWPKSALNERAKVAEQDHVLAHSPEFHLRCGADNKLTVALHHGLHRAGGWPLLADVMQAAPCPSSGSKCHVHSHNPAAMHVQLH